MLGLEITTKIGDRFNESQPETPDKDEPSDSSMFHGTIDLIGSSDEDYESELTKVEDEAKPKLPALHESGVSDVIENGDICYAREDLDKEVIATMDDMVDFVERNVMFPEFGYDPDGMVKQKDVVLREGSCMKPYCQLGCLCSSLRGAFQHVPTHCSKEVCMFECHCQAKGLSVMDDETHYADKTKRKKKIPNRFKDVVLGRAYKKLHARSIHHDSDNSNSDSDYETCLIPAYKKTSPVCSPPKGPSPEPKVNGVISTKSDNSWINSDKIANIKKTIAERRVGFVANTIAEEQTLADVNIWCSQHNKYSCLCINYVYFSRTNYLLWKPSNRSRYLANKVMFEIQLKQPSHHDVPYEVFPYNRNNHCARTHGALLDYRVRNKDEVFVSKRKLELEHNVLQYSNSYVKFRNFLLVKGSEPIPSAEPCNNDGKKRGLGKKIVIVKTAEKCRLDVGEEDLDVKVSYQLDEDFSEEDEDQKLTVSGRKRKLTQKMKDLEEERRKEKEAEEEDMKKIQEEIRLRQAMEEVPLKVPRKRGRPPKPKNDAEVADKPKIRRSIDGEKRLAVVRRTSNDERLAMDIARRQSKDERLAMDFVRRMSNDERLTMDVMRRTSKDERLGMDVVRRTSKDERLAMDVVHRTSNDERLAVDIVHRPSNRIESGMARLHEEGLPGSLQNPKVVPNKKNGIVFLTKVERNEEVTIKEEPDSPDYYSAESRMDMEVEHKEDAPAELLGHGLTIVKTTKSANPPRNFHKPAKDPLEKDLSEDAPRPFLGFSDCDDNSEVEDCDSDFIDSIHGKKVLVLSPRSDGYPHLGLMCLTPGIGYLNVIESLRGRIVITDPANPVRHQTFNTIGAANEWLNRVFRSQVLFSTPDLVLQWILVKPGVLKQKRCRPVSPEIFHDPNLVITHNGPIRFQQNHQTNPNVAKNCSLLRKQLSEHSVFRSLINKQLTVQGSANTRHTKTASKWVPNPKFRMKHADVQATSVTPIMADAVSVQRFLAQSSHSAPPQLTPVQRTLQFTPVNQSGRIYPQATLRPLPNLTKILGNNVPAISSLQTE